jgi:tRNA A37 N6-isopentenylltransferase MiaA
MYKLLQTLDPTVAARWHWRDTRKVSRSLKIIAETGRLPSDIIAEQSETDLTARYGSHSGELPRNLETLDIELCSSGCTLSPML